MATISERLRAEIPPNETALTRNERLRIEASDVIDALTAALDGLLPMVKRHAEPEYLAAVAALSLARKGG
jgi:hypothetical protein